MMAMSNIRLKTKRIKIAYCGTIMVDYCPVEELLDQFLDFFEKLNLKLVFFSADAFMG